MIYELREEGLTIGFRPDRCVRTEEPMAKKKLTKAERLVDEQMLALLEWASENPKNW